jgi:hypothetical protein
MIKTNRRQFSDHCSKSNRPTAESTPQKQTSQKQTQTQFLYTKQANSDFTPEDQTGKPLSPELSIHGTKNLLKFGFYFQTKPAKS